MKSDSVAYIKFPHHRKWFNKLWFSESMGYNCGPAGINPRREGYYIVRPVINLSGMSAGAIKQYIKSGELDKVPPGYFWCEFFEGAQYSVTYQWIHDKWMVKSCWRGYTDGNNLSRFSKWERCDHLQCHSELPKIFSELSEIEIINVEFIDGRPIEVHLRSTPDPDYDLLIPIWEDNKNLIDKYKEMGYNIISSYDNADGFIDIARIAFAVKNRKD